MEHAPGVLWEVTLWEFLFVTVFLAGGAAYLAGRAVARAWESTARLIAYMLLLAAATRFIHFALFGGTLLSAHYLAVDFAVLTACALTGKRMTRARQMATQYGFEDARRNRLQGHPAQGSQAISSAPTQ